MSSSNRGRNGQSRQKDEESDHLRLISTKNSRLTTLNEEPSQENSLLADNHEDDANLDPEHKPFSDRKPYLRHRNEDREVKGRFGNTNGRDKTNSNLEEDQN